MTQLRRLYFAQAGHCAAHLGVCFDRVVQHLWNARRCRAPLPLRRITNVDDLVYAVACMDGSERAWRELNELYEPWLVRRFRRDVGVPAAVLVVRQTLVELRRVDGEDGGASLAEYLGIQPLRDWLTGRVYQHLAHRAVEHNHQPAMSYALR